MKKKMKIIIALISVALLFVTLIIARGIWENNSPTLNKITIKSDQTPNSFKGFKIAHLSDLHNAEIGEGNYKVLDILKEAKPDIIVITGDLVDSRRTNFKIAVDFCQKANVIAPIYYAPGNHESRLGNYRELIEKLKSVGVFVLQNQKTTINKGEDYITLIGVMDSSFFSFYGEMEEEETKNYYVETLDMLTENDNSFKVVLSHRPEQFGVYKKEPINLVLCGHAHGGQFILPLIGGLFAPGQGFFPKYTQGVFTENQVSMVVSRGLGNSGFPFRLNNRPEVILIELE